MQNIRVLSVASEIYPLIKTGGLADVTGALPVALAPEAIEIRTLVPGYPAVVAALGAVQEVLARPDLYGGPARVIAATAADLKLFVVDAPHLYGRPGNPYCGPDGGDWADNGLRFAALARIAADIGQGAIASFVPDIVHAHDWQAALAHAFLHYEDRPRPGTLTTIHNIAFQGRFPAAIFPLLGLPAQAFAIDGVEYYGDVGYLKAGLQFADHITTVSPTYATEIQTVEAGMGLDGVLRARADRLSGILNGIDVAVWDPETDARIAGTYSVRTLTGRAVNKRTLLHLAGLPDRGDTLVLGVVSRLAWQKGLDLVLDALPAILAGGHQLVVLGSGDRALEDRYVAAARAHPDQVSVKLGYDEDFAHLIQAGADALLVPSRFEPCGLTQLCALRYGAIPIVSRLGGLADTVIDANEMAVAAGVATGVQFAPVTSEALVRAVRRAGLLFHDKPVWQDMQRNGMASDVSWRRPAARYADLYREIVDARR